MLNQALFRSDSGEWETPPALFALASRMYGPFDLDPAATARNAKAPRYYTREDNGLALPWAGRVWLNPPCGKSIGLWTAKCLDDTWAGRAKLVVALLPARCDTNWWHRDVMQADLVHLLVGRVRFVGAPSSAPFPSCLVVWKRTGLLGPPEFRSLRIPREQK